MSLLQTTYKILSNILLSRLTPYAEENTGNISVEHDVTGKLLIIYSAFIKYLKKEWEYNKAMHQLFIDLKKPTFQLGGRFGTIFSLLSLVSP
jgi:hypothetical protein